MEIIEVQYFEQEDFPAGYGRTPWTTESEKDIWNLIMETMNRNPSKRYLKHFQRSEWVPNPNGRVWEHHPELNIPLGTHREFLQVYVEDK